MEDLSRSVSVSVEQSATSHRPLLSACGRLPIREGTWTARIADRDARPNSITEPTAECSDRYAVSVPRMSTTKTSVSVGSIPACGLPDVP
jgi:hypothetical protein